MIIFIDADGTLLNDEKHVPKSSVKAIQSARLNGHQAIFLRRLKMLDSMDSSATMVLLSNQMAK